MLLHRYGPRLFHTHVLKSVIWLQAVSKGSFETVCYKIIFPTCRLPYYLEVMSTPHILIVDDDPEIRDLVSRFLVKHDLRTDTAANGQELFKKLEVGSFDLIVLDLMMPGEDGLTLCRKIRSQSSIPIIMLTALGEDTDRIVGLEMGADDYIAKPFNPRELLARIKAVLRRFEQGEQNSLEEVQRGKALTFNGWSLDLTKRELRTEDGVLVTLTAGEFDMLSAFLERPNRVLSRDQLLDLTKGRNAGPFDRSIDVQLSRLRRKIEVDPKDPKIIKTVRGGGYILSAKVERL